MVTNKMDDGDTKLQLYKKLSGLVLKTSAIKDVYENQRLARPAGMSQSLARIFGEKVHFLSGDFRSLKSLQDSDNVIKSIASLIKSDGGILQKPIITILNESYEAPEETELLTSRLSEGSDWYTLVILPKNYTTCFHYKLNNSTEIIFFKDSKGEAILKILMQIPSFSISRIY